MCPVIQEDLLVVLGGGGILDDDSGVAVAQDTFTRPVHAGYDDNFVIEDEAFVVNIVLNLHVVEIYAGCLKGIKPALRGLKFTQDYFHVQTDIDLGSDRVDQFRKLGISRIAGWMDVLKLDVKRLLHGVNEIQDCRLVDTWIGRQEGSNGDWFRY